LRAVRVGAGVGHGEEERSVVGQLEVLVGELVTVDGLAASAVATGEVTTLEHKVGDDAVELVELGVGVTETLLASAEGTEVLDRLGDDVVVELEVDTSSAGLNRIILGGNFPGSIGLVLGTSPGDIKVGLDNHVGRRSVEGTTGGGGKLLLGEERAGEEGGSRCGAGKLEHRCNQWNEKVSSGGVDGGARKASVI